VYTWFLLAMSVLVQSQSNCQALLLCLVDRVFALDTEHSIVFVGLPNDVDALFSEDSSRRFHGAVCAA
jgi:hypothetical protein